MVVVAVSPATAKGCGRGVSHKNSSRCKQGVRRFAPVDAVRPIVSGAVVLSGLPLLVQIHLQSESSPPKEHTRSWRVGQNGVRVLQLGTLAFHSHLLYWSGCRGCWLITAPVRLRRV